MTNSPDTSTDVVTPYLVVKGAAAAIDFYKKNFGAVEKMRMEDGARTRTRTVAMPVRLGPGGIVEVLLPSLSVVEQVALDNAMQL